MKLSAVLLFLTFGASAWAAPVPKELTKVDKLDGLWEVTSLEVLGQPGAVPQKQRWRIEAGNKITVEQVVPNAAVRIRPAIGIKVNDSASPKSLDYNTGAATPKLAIYEIEGDTLKILLRFQGNERPTELKSDDSTILYVFKRVKE